MEFDQETIVRALQSFRVKNVLPRDNVGMGQKLTKISEVLVQVRHQMILGCTDERSVNSLLDPKSGEKKDPTNYSIVRVVGGAFGLVDAVRNVHVTTQRQDILAELGKNDVLAANHIDTQAQEGELTGCGQAQLRSLVQSSSLFDRPPQPVTPRLQSFEEDGAWRMVLTGEHVAQGFIINPFSNMVLDPNLAAADHAFFSLDLGVYYQILQWIKRPLQLNDDLVRAILVKLTRNNMAAVFILSNAAIRLAHFVETDTDLDSYFAGVVGDALGELKAREAAILHVLEQRMKS